MPGHTSAVVVTVDPSEVFHQGMRASLARGGRRILGQATSPKEAIQLLAGLDSDLVVVGPNFAEHEGLDLCRALIHRWRDMKVIIVTPYTDDPLFMADAVNAGAAACLRRRSKLEELRVAVDAVIAGHCLFSHEVLSLGFQPIKLTERECQVLTMIAEHKTDREIAAELMVAFPTIRNHVQHILLKLAVHDRRAAVRRARRRGLIVCDALEKI